MDLDPRIARYAPLALPLVIFAGGWMLLVQPRFSESTRASREVAGLRERLDEVRSSLAQELPPASTSNPAESFERETAVGDATARLLEQLARLAAAAPAANLLIETGQRASMSAAGSVGPQVAGAAVPDPRFRLFNTELSYSPVTMSFDAEYARVGDVLWGLRDLVTTVELRGVDIKPLESASGRVHVTIQLFAYARPNVAAAGAAAGTLR